jgi:hypothetical protein
MVEDAAFTSRYVLGTPVRTALPAGPFYTRTILLERLRGNGGGPFVTQVVLS